MADVRMRWRKNGSVIAMIQIENQSEINNIMPIRDLGYIFNNYNEQIKEHQRENERNGKRFYARELGDDERLQPVITFVLYYGKEEWKRPLSILDMLDLDEEEKKELENIFTVRLGTQTECNAWTGGRALLPFLRLQVGISEEAIQTKFGSFLNPETLNPVQLSYCQQIIDYVRQNGYMATQALQAVSPFCDVNVLELFDDKFIYVKQLLNGLNKPVL